MSRQSHIRHAALLSLTLLATACANNGGMRDGGGTSTVVPAGAPASVDGTSSESMPASAASDPSVATAESGQAIAPLADGASAAPPSATTAAGDPATQAEQDYDAIYGTPYDPIADPTLPDAAVMPLSFDPWEPFNRRVHSFNKVVDRVIAKPLAKAYEKVVPDPARRGVTNFFNNLGQPVTIVNALLQGKPRYAASSLGRFALNSTVGIAGIFDPATKVKIPNRSEDFGQTLGVWGWKRSRYLELPLFGPRTVRDTFGIVGDAPLSPVRYVENDKARVFLQGLDLVNVRTQLFPLDNLTVGAADEYALIRDSWLQRRDYQISGGNNGKTKEGEQPLPDYLIEDDSNPTAPAGSIPPIPSGIR